MNVLLLHIALHSFEANVPVGLKYLWVPHALVQCFQVHFTMLHKTLKLNRQHLHVIEVGEQLFHMFGPRLKLLRNVVNESLVDKTQVQVWEVAHDGLFVFNNA